MSWFKVDRCFTQVGWQAGSLRESPQANVPLGSACHKLAAAQYNVSFLEGKSPLYARFAMGSRSCFVPSYAKESASLAGQRIFGSAKPPRAMGRFEITQTKGHIKEERAP